MLVPIKWLKDYIKIDVDVKEFGERMIMSGSNIETTETLLEGIEKVYVGKIEKIEKHPDADKLVICSVNIGKEENLQIVTGAPNVYEGALVPVVVDGGRIPGSEKKEGGIKIKKGKLRGVESFGMLCSLSELGFEDKVIPLSQREGIWILEEGTKIGEEIGIATELDDSVVEFEITPNRADCLSMIGMARETKATFGGEVKYPAPATVETEGEANNHIEIEIKDENLCNRYIGKVVTDVKVEESPWWLQRRLITAGMRPINNIVDITNFVLLEYGQPIHAFDIEEVAGRKIIVERAKEDEVFTTLDEKERQLDSTMLMIKDAEKSIALAGIMGGLNSEIKEGTKNILVEVANFNADNVRATSKTLGLRTEASSRYEKGIDPNICAAAAERVCQLIEELNAGTVVSGTVDSYPVKYSSTAVAVRPSRVNGLLGTDITVERMVEILESLEIKCEIKDTDIIATPPTVRLDLKKEIDFVEEVARIYGYDKLPMTIPAGNAASKKTDERTLQDKAKDVMCALGANEIQTYSFVSPRDVDRIRLAEDTWERDFVVLRNPLGEENSVMRTILAPSMLEVLGRNFSRNIEAVRAFEINTTFSNFMVEEGKLPQEDTGMVIGFYGKDEDFFTLKGAICQLLKELGIEEPNFEAEGEYGLYHPGRCARISIGDEEIGIMGEVHPEVRKTYGIDTRCYVCEFFFDGITRNSSKEISYSPLPKYPAITRDIALLVKEEVEVGAAIALIKENAGTLLESVELFDVYRGKQVEEGKKSIAFTMTFRDKNKTLTDDDVVKVYKKTLEVLEQSFEAVLREV